PTWLTVSGRTSGTTTQTDTSSRLNPGKSQGRPIEKPGLEAHRAKRPTRLRSPKKAPVPDQPNLRSEPDGPSEKQFHAANPGKLAGRDRGSAWVSHRSSAMGRCST